MLYRQCEMQRRSHVQVAWIPAKFAAVGKFVRLRDSDGWQVTRVGATASDGYVREHERDHRTAFASLL